MWVKLEASQARMGADLDRLLLHSGGLENLSNYFHFFTHTSQVIVRKTIDYDMNFILPRLGGSSTGGQSSQGNF